MTSLLGREMTFDFFEVLTQVFSHPNAPFCLVIVKSEQVVFFFWYTLIKNTTSTSVIAAFSKILKQSGHFSTLQTDLGSEFTNKAFQSWIKHHNIHFFTTQPRN